MRDAAYAIVQRNALKAWDEGSSFRKLCEQDPEVSGRLSSDKLDECFGYDRHLAFVDEIFSRFEE